MLISVALAGAPQPIIHGESAEATDWPMTGGMLVAGEVRVHSTGETGSTKLLLCSSTLIAPDVVLVAAHCVDVAGMLGTLADHGVELLDEPRIGWSREVDLSLYGLALWTFGVPLDWPADTVLASDLRVHPDFELAAVRPGLADNRDLGLLFLEEPVLDVPFALLPTPAEAAQVEVGREVVVVGWGQQDVTPEPGTVGVKQQGVGTITAVSPWEFKVGEVPDDTRKCHGDSGGPSFLAVGAGDDGVTSAEDHRLVGVTSHVWDIATDCAATGGVDTRVDHFLGWIDATMRAGCADGARAWCEVEGIVPPPDALARLAGHGGAYRGGGWGCAGVGPGVGPGLPGGLLALTLMLAVRGVGSTLR